MNSRKILAVLALGALAFGCRKSAESERDEAARAAAEAEKTAMEESRKSADKTNRKTLEAMEEHNDFLAAVRREQLDLRGRVQDAIDDIDKKLLEYKVEHSKNGEFVIPSDTKDRGKIDELLRKRAALKADADAIENASPEEWDQLKVRVDKNLGSFGKGRI
jgi:hypothetical protein